jgi:hypothetical protein
MIPVCCPEDRPDFQWDLSFLCNFEPFSIELTVIPSQFLIGEKYQHLEMQLLSRIGDDEYQPLLQIEYYILYKYCQEMNKIQNESNWITNCPLFNILFLPTIESIGSVATCLHIKDPCIDPLAFDEGLDPSILVVGMEKLDFDEIPQMEMEDEVSKELFE